MTFNCTATAPTANNLTSNGSRSSSGVKGVARLVRTAAAAACMSTLAGTAAATALTSPLASNDWTQVGQMVADGNLFNGNCNLDLSGACTYTSNTDYWSAMPAANQILFITGDGQYWGHASYGALRSLITAAEGDFAPNLTWIDAGRNGVSVGAITGNVLFRNGSSEDPWVTMEGTHCAHYSNAAPCNEMLWGEGAFSSWTPSHGNLQMNHGGIQVWARATPQRADPTVPEPTGLALVGAALLGLVATRRRKA